MYKGLQLERGWTDTERDVFRVLSQAPGSTVTHEEIARCTNLDIWDVKDACSTLHDEGIMEGFSGAAGLNAQGRRLVQLHATDGAAVV